MKVYNKHYLFKVGQVKHEFGQVTFSGHLSEGPVELLVNVEPCFIWEKKDTHKVLKFQTSQTELITQTSEKCTQRHILYALHP